MFRVGDKVTIYRRWRSEGFNWNPIMDQFIGSSSKVKRINGFTRDGIANYDLEGIASWVFNENSLIPPEWDGE